MGYRYTRKPSVNIPAGGHSLRDGLVAALLFNEQGGGFAFDSRGQRWTLTGTTGAPAWTPGPDGYALAFTAANAHRVSAPAALPLMSSTAWSIAWQARASNVSFACVLGTASGNIIYQRPSVNSLNFFPGNTTIGSVTGQTSWQSYCLSCTGTTVTAYVNGVSAGTATLSGFSWSAAPNIGFVSAGTQFDGTMSRFAFWSRPLSAHEARQACLDPFAIYGRWTAPSAFDVAAGGFIPAWAQGSSVVIGGAW